MRSKSLDEVLTDFRASVAGLEVSSEELAEAETLLSEVYHMPAERRRRLVRLLELIEALRAEAGEEVVDELLRSLKAHTERG